MVLWGLGVFIAASTVRNILLRPRPRPEGAPVTTSMKPEKKPRQIVARYPNHVWSVDRTRVWRCVLRKYSSARQDSHLDSLDSESGPGLLPAASHYRGTKAQGPFGDFEQRRSSTRLTNADLT